MCEKLRIFPVGRYIVGNDPFLAFWWRSQVQNRNEGCEEMYKDVNTVPGGFFRTRQSRHSCRYRWRHYHWRLLCKYIGRCLCKRVDVYIITLSCTWRIYALSERLLVVIIFSQAHFPYSFVTVHTHTQPSYGPHGFCMELPRWASTGKVKPIWIYWSKR